MIVLSRPWLSFVLGGRPRPVTLLKAKPEALYSLHNSTVISRPALNLSLVTTRTYPSPEEPKTMLTSAAWTLMVGVKALAEEVVSR